MKTKKPKCPNCGNTDEKTIEDNGVAETSALYTLLCIARVEPGEDSFNGDASPPLEVGTDGKVACSMQWEPNAQ